MSITHWQAKYFADKERWRQITKRKEKGEEMKCYYRTVRDNRIRLLGRRIHCKNLKNGELDGQRLCFIPYAGKVKPSFSTTGLTALWGRRRGTVP